MKSIPVCIPVDGRDDELCGYECPFKRKEVLHYPAREKCSLFDIGLVRAKPEYPEGPARHFRCDECNAAFS